MAVQLLHLMPKNLAGLSLHSDSPPDSSLTPDFIVCDIQDCHKVLKDRPAVGGHRLCSKHQKAVSKLIKSTFATTDKVPKKLMEHRYGLMTAVLSARRTNASAGDATSSMFWFPNRAIHDDASSDDETASEPGSEPCLEDANAPAAVAKTLPSLPWVQSTKLATVVESDEEDDDGASSSMGSGRNF